MFSKLKRGFKKAVELGKKLGKSALENVLGKKNQPNSVADKLSPHDRLMARLSDQAYKKDRAQDFDGYTLDNELSNNDAAVYSKGDHVAIAWRGTKLDNASDLATDAKIMSGEQAGTKRFREAEDLYQKVRKKHKTKKMSLTGHSLGGSQAAHIGEKYADAKHNTVVFNPGRGIDAGYAGNRLLCKLKMVSKNKCRAVRTHAIRGDPISALQTGNRTEHRTRNLNPHSLDNFL